MAALRRQGPAGGVESGVVGLAPRCAAWLIVLAAALGALSGCALRPIEPAAAVPSYAELARRYNAQLGAVRRLRASLTVAYSGLDEQGRRQDNQGDGQLAIVLPDRIRCSVTHIGRSGILLWAGSDERGYWLYDGRQPDARKLYYGRHAEFDRGPGRDLDLPLHPRQLPLLLGIVPLPEDPPGPDPVVHAHKGFWLVNVPGTPARLWIDARTGRAARVDILDRAGASPVRAIFEEFRPIEVGGQPPGAWPLVPARIRIMRPQRGEELRLSLSALRDADIKDQWFDLNLLLDKVFHVPEQDRIDLDEPAE